MEKFRFSLKDLEDIPADCSRSTKRIIAKQLNMQKHQNPADNSSESPLSKKSLRKKLIQTFAEG